MVNIAVPGQCNILKTVVLGELHHEGLIPCLTTRFGTTSSSISGYGVWSEWLAGTFAAKLEVHVDRKEQVISLALGARPVLSKSLLCAIPEELLAEVFPKRDYFYFRYIAAVSFTVLEKYVSCPCSLEQRRC